MTDDGAVRHRDFAARNLDVGLHAPATSGKREPSARAEPVGKLSNRVEAFDTQESFELRESIEVLRARRASRQRGASRQPVNSKTSLELVEEEADLRFRPYADHSDPEFPAAARDPGFQELGK